MFVPKPFPGQYIELLRLSQSSCGGSSYILPFPSGLCYLSARTQLLSAPSLHPTVHLPCFVKLLPSLVMPHTSQSPNSLTWLPRFRVIGCPAPFPAPLACCPHSTDTSAHSPCHGGFTPSCIAAVCPPHHPVLHLDIAVPLQGLVILSECSPGQLHYCIHFIPIFTPIYSSFS